MDVDVSGDAEDSVLFEDFRYVSGCMSSTGASDQILLEAESSDPRACVLIGLVAPDQGSEEDEIELPEGYSLASATVHASNCFEAKGAPVGEGGVLHDGIGSIETEEAGVSTYATIDVTFGLPGDDTNPYNADRVRIVEENVRLLSTCEDGGD